MAPGGADGRERDGAIRELPWGLQHHRHPVVDEIHLISLLEGSETGGSSSAELSTPAAAKAAGAQSEERIAEAVAAGIATGLAGLVPKLGGGLRLDADKKRAADERSRKRREYEADYEVDGVRVKRKAQKGGYEDAPMCTRKGCQKASWCAYSHAHMP